MRKSVRVTLIAVTAVLLAAILVLSLVGFGIVGLITWVMGGRPSPASAAEAAGLHMSENAYVDAERIRLYYTTAAETYGAQDGAWEDWLGDVLPVTKNNLLFWYPVTRPHSAPLYRDGSGDAVASLAYVEVDGKYHYFLIPFYARENGEPHAPICLPEGFPEVFDSIEANGNSYAAFKHGYFVTDAPVEELQINGIDFSIHKKG